MDAAALAKTKSGLKKRNSIDRSKPMVEDAAHPGSGGIMKAISSGTFALKHVDKAGTHDASAPMLEAGTAYHTDIRPAVFAEVHQVRRNSLKPTKTNDRSEPVIEKWVHVDVMHKPARACVIDEIKEKKASIDALHTFNEHHTKAEIEKRTRPALMVRHTAHQTTLSARQPALFPPTLGGALPPQRWVSTLRARTLRRPF
jgi:hypothetical protein